VLYFSHDAELESFSNYRELQVSILKPYSVYKRKTLGAWHSYATMLAGIGRVRFRKLKISES